MRTIPKPRSIGLAVCLLLLTGCSFYFNPADPVPELLLYEGFNWYDTGQRWSAGTLSGLPISADISTGRLNVFGPQHFLTTIERFTTSLTVLVEWSVLNGDVTNQELPAANEQFPDYVVRMEDVGVSVQLSLYQQLASGDREDRFAIVDSNGATIASTVVTSANRTSGTLEIRFFSSPDGLDVVANAPELGMVLAASATPTKENNSRITVEVSGLPNDPRSLNEIYLLRERVNLGDIQ